MHCVCTAMPSKQCETDESIEWCVSFCTGCKLICLHCCRSWKLHRLSAETLLNILMGQRSSSRPRQSHTYLHLRLRRSELSAWVAMDLSNASNQEVLKHECASARCLYCRNFTQGTHPTVDCTHRQFSWKTPDHTMDHMTIQTFCAITDARLSNTACSVQVLWCVRCHTKRHRGTEQVRR